MKESVQNSDVKQDIYTGTGNDVTGSSQYPSQEDTDQSQFE